MTADEPMSTPDSGRGPKYRDRSNHDVTTPLGEDMPCFCWATSGHRLGEEVRTRPEPVPTPDTRQWSIEAEAGTRAYASEDVALSVAAGYDGFTLGSKRLRVVKSFTRPDPDSEWTPITPDSADDDTVGERNPYLPEPPADGEHIFNGGYRCTRCGVYNRPQPENPPFYERCEGGWAQSGKMRFAAERKWAEEKEATPLATPPADDANRAPVSGGLDEGEREALARALVDWLAACDAAWAERLAALEGEARRLRDRADALASDDGSGA